MENLEFYQLENGLDQKKIIEYDVFPFKYTIFQKDYSNYQFLISNLNTDLVIDYINEKKAFSNFLKKKF